MRLVSKADYSGLRLPPGVVLDGEITAIIGRNGAGKTRLLKALMHGSVEALIDDKPLPVGSMQFFDFESLKPSLAFSCDVPQFRRDLELAQGLFSQYREYFQCDPALTLEAFGRGFVENHRLSSGRGDLGQVVRVASYVSSLLKKNANELDPQDIADCWQSYEMSALGSLNVAGIMVAYCERIERHRYNSFRNKEYQENHTVLDQEELARRFGPPPWEVFNDFLRVVFDGRFRINSPTQADFASYRTKLIRDDGLEIEPDMLSSGEKVLMWLCLSMYNSGSGRFSNPPKLLLLDEPDGALHPEMVQKLLMALRQIVEAFGTKIIFTTHSPTTVALMGANPIFRISEAKFELVEKDVAISELLVGVDQVSMHFTNQRQIYVESHHDAEIYKTLFDALKSRSKVMPHISLSFIPAAPKLAESSVKQLLKAHLGCIDDDRRDAFIEALNGQSNCAQVIGAVESLVGEGNQTVHGIVDWDLKNSPKDTLHVLGKGLFYALENALLNPLTLGLYLLQNQRGKIKAEDFGLDDGYDMDSIYSSQKGWQAISDCVAKHVLNVTQLENEIECEFLNGNTVSFDKRYVLEKGHDLETFIKNAYPFLNEFRKGNDLLMAVAVNGVESSKVCTLPTAFLQMFKSIQSPH